MKYTLSIKQRIKRVLIQIVESENTSAQDKLSATKELMEVIALEDVRKFQLGKLADARRRARAAKKKEDAAFAKLATPKLEPITLPPAKIEPNALGL